ncbi:hypothetical protein LSAT2_030575 [Lamellibrachia satsuma]|nr:hypothetical protein LSAT2_030575 [Lamellibrachia satsuma]
MKIYSDELLTAPYAVRDIGVTYATPLQLQLSWTEPKVKNGELLKYTVTYNGTYNGKKTDMPEEQTKVLTVSDASKETYAMNIRGLKHGYIYIFVVSYWSLKQQT